MATLFRDAKDLSTRVGLWYEENYKDKSSSRFETFKLTLQKLYERTSSPIIVETGTVRMENDYGAGYSTYIFGECIGLFGGKLYTIDVNKDNVELSQRLTKKFSKNITYINDDSLNFITNFDLSIDLLYLDSMDCPLEGDASQSQIHNLKEFLAATKNIHDKSLILLDDSNLPNGGNSRITHIILQYLGYSLMLSNQQSLWSKIV